VKDGTTGSIFAFVLPVSESSYKDSEKADGEDNQDKLYPLTSPTLHKEEEVEREGTEKKFILAVDDDIDVANYIRILLSPYYNVRCVYDADSAIKAMEEEEPDLVLSDVMMPGKGGYQLCSEIKGNSAFSHIPVVLVTAKSGTENQVKGLKEGADAYVTKPFDPAYLLALIESQFENREKLRAAISSSTLPEELPEDTLAPQDKAFMKDLYALMEEELGNSQLDITTVSGMMKMSRTKFYYKIKGLTGDNPGVFFRRYKLNRAAKLLLEGKYNMSEIADMTGFNSLSHFSTSFKKQFGVPPSEYRG
jgi:DNA-binding response OmpR family regulator